MESNNETKPTDTYGVVEIKDVVPGETLMLNSSDIEPIKVNPPEQEQPKTTLTRDKFMNILSQMIASGDITPRQAMEMRGRFGITNASFHNKKINKAKKKKAKALAYRNRRINRLNGSTKGQTKQHYHKSLGK